ncbi:hypothetical protein IKU74_08730 [bacterium]|nr:hypothetical protein [bacterium]
MIRNEIIKFAQENGFDSAELLGEYNGYTVYDPVFNDNKYRCIGLPHYILEHENKLEMIYKEEDTQPIIDYFFPDED